MEKYCPRIDKEIPFDKVCYGFTSCYCRDCPNAEREKKRRMEADKAGESWSFLLPEEKEN